MKDFFDRDSAYKEVRIVVQQIIAGTPCAVWVEGLQGVGKTRFIEYVCSQNVSLNVFKYNNNDIFYKCESGSENSAFSFVSSLLYEMQRNNPKKFVKTVQKYFNKINHITLLEACCSIIPQLSFTKVVSNLIENRYKKIADMQEKISDLLVQQQLIDLFADMVLDILTHANNSEGIVFCIDDIQWIDIPSLKTFERIIKKGKQIRPNFEISLFVTIRDRDSLNIEETQTYTQAYNVIESLFNYNMKSIWLSNFNIEILRDIITKTGRFALQNYISEIFEATLGNPLEIVLTLQFPDDRVKEVVGSKEIGDKYLNRDAIFTSEHIKGIFSKGNIYSVILNVLSILRQSVPLNVLFQCVTNVYFEIYNNKCVYYEFKNAISFFECECYIKIDSVHKNEVSLSYDAIWQVVLDFITQNGDYVVYVKSISSTLLNLKIDEVVKSRTLKLSALNMLLEVDARECFNQFKSLYNRLNNRVDVETIVIGTNAFCSHWSNINNINASFMIKNILPMLLTSSNLKVAYRLCHVVFPKYKEYLTYEEQINFLVGYIKVQTDLSNLRNDDESALPLFDIISKYIFYNKDQELQILLLGMSVYEHVLDHDKIKKLYAHAEELVSTNYLEISKRTLAIFYRNKGLCFSHITLKNDYFKALINSLGISNFTYRHLLYGTSINNLGLSYFYNGEIENAKKAFLSSERHLSIIGYNVARIKNNIGVCYMMLHDYERAYQYFSDAVLQQTEGCFIVLCSRTNLALALYSLNKVEEAKNMLDEIIREYKDGSPRTPDTLPYCSAMINYGYIAFREKNYFKAAECYKESQIHTYRYQNEEQTIKRKEMLDLTLRYATDNIDASSNCLDLADTGNDIFKKGYSLVPFAFYVI